MRFKLTLQPDAKVFGNRMPLNYQYELSAFIYRAIAHADGEYAEWLHENGFRLNNRPFKLFTFSHFFIPKYLIDREHGCIRINSERVEWFVSFLPETSTETFISGLFAEQVFQIGNRQSVVQFRVERIEALQPPVFERQMSFRTLSPVCIPFLREEQRYATYLSPDTPEASTIVLNNLLNKYHTFYGKPYEEDTRDFAFRITNQPKAKLIVIKQGTPEASNIRGYMFDFQMTAPTELLKVMYECGLGYKNSAGFGMVEVNAKRKSTVDTKKSPENGG
ncbi:MAG: CRISPR-associated endoribonuclease Cas6 [Bacteroidales bacterium]|jgi:CRISPR-associated endoribonuclease Cas6|nr:CRISPR-associated endoribonuclease Cas6 [Bacteroidales bacterium]